MRSAICALFRPSDGKTLVLSMIVGGAVAYSLDHPYALIVILACCLGIYVFFCPLYSAVIIAFLFATFVNLLVRGIGYFPVLTLWGGDFVILILLMRTCTMTWNKSKRLIPRTNINFLVILFCLSCAVSTIALGDSFTGVRLLLGFRAYLKYMIIFYVISGFGCHERDVKHILNFLVFLCLTTPWLAFAQRYLWGWPTDKCGGWMDTGSLSVFGSSLIILMLSRMYYRGVKAGNLVVLFSLGCSFLIGQIRLPFFLIPLICIFLFGQRIIKKVSHFIVISAIAACLVIMAWNAPKGVSMDDFKEFVTHPDSLYEYFTITYDQELNRIPAMIFACKYVSQTAWNSLFGYGLYYTSYSELFGDMAIPWLAKLKVYHYQFSKTVIETGFVGFLIFLLILKKIYKTAGKRLKDSEYKHKYLAMAMQGIAGIYAVGVVYNDLWNLDATAMLFWTLAGIVYAKRDV